MICEITPKKQPDYLLNFWNFLEIKRSQSSIFLRLDGKLISLSGKKPFQLSTDIIFNDKENLEKYMREWPLKLTEHSITKHPFSNISLFVHLMEQKKSLTIRQSFQYRPNSIVNGIFDRPEDERHTKTWDILYTVASGGTVITFEGKHMNSTMFPMLSLSFRSTNIQKPVTLNPIVSSVLCTVLSKTAITCVLPQAPNSLLPIAYFYPLRVQYVLHLDGQQIDSSRLPVDKETQVQLKESEILYYPEPQLTSFVAELVLVSIQILQVTLKGKYLRKELPYEIRVYSSEYLTSSTDGIKCIIFETANETVANFIKCKLDVVQEQVESFIDKKMHLSVTVGNRTKKYVY